MPAAVAIETKDHGRVRVRLRNHRLVPVDSVPGLPWIHPADCAGGFDAWHAVARQLQERRTRRR